jgi:Zn-dependent oligopeptidase
VTKLHEWATSLLAEQERPASASFFFDSRKRDIFKESHAWHQICSSSHDPKAIQTSPIMTNYLLRTLFISAVTTEKSSQ